MATVYFTRADFRSDMRCPNSGARAHAVCRRVTGAPSDSVVYGAVYWAGCTMLGPNRRRFNRRLARAFDRFCVECDSRSPQLSASARRRLFCWAVRRVRAVRLEANALPTSVLW